MRRVGQVIVTHEQFVKAWRRARSIHDMISYTGLNYDYIYKRASKLRKAGVVLEPWRKGLGPIDPGKLNGL